MLPLLFTDCCVAWLFVHHQPFLSRKLKAKRRSNFVVTVSLEAKRVLEIGSFCGVGLRNPYGLAERADQLRESQDA